MSENEENKKIERPLQHAKLSSNIKMTETLVSKDDIINEYCLRIAEVIPHLKELKKNELFRILMLTIAPPFLMGDRVPWKAKNRKEESIASHLFNIDDLKIALVEVITLEKEAKKHERAKEKKSSDEQVIDRSGNDGTKL